MILQDINIATKKNILIIDDEAQNIHLLAQTLKYKYNILVATSGQHGIDLVNTKPYPDLILLDIVMPDINGFDVCKRLKASIKSKDIPIIFITAKDSIEDEEQGLEIGAVDFIRKPFSPDIVKARVKTHLFIQNQKLQILQNELVLKVTLEATKDGIIVLDNQFNILLTNQKFYSLWNFPKQIVASNSIHKMLAYVMPQLIDGESRIANIDQLFESDKSETDMLEFKDGRIFYCYTKALIQGNTKIGRVISYSDITKQKKYEAKLHELSITDALTGLYNRRKLNDLIKEGLQQAQRYQQEIAIVMIDIDKFKEINDNFGHDTGDLVLKNLALSMQDNFRSVDRCFRFGGDEFCVVIPNTDLNGTLEATERFREHICNLDFNGLKIGISIGITLSAAKNGESVEYILKHADKALYLAKTSGRNQTKFY